MDDNAMDYEFLIRRAHQCGRRGVTGADADTFRKLQRLALIYKSEKKAIETKSERKWNQSEEKMLSEYMQSAGEVSAYIKTAIEFVMKKYESKLSDEDYNKLEDVLSLLSNPDLDKINEAVENAQGVIINIGLYPK